MYKLISLALLTSLTTRDLRLLKRNSSISRFFSHYNKIFVTNVKENLEKRKAATKKTLK